MFRFSTSTSLEHLRQNDVEFNYGKMKWDDWQTPRNLFLAMIGELGELAIDAAKNETFGLTKDRDLTEEDGGKTDDDALKVEEILNELADVFSYLICLANECCVDIATPDAERLHQPSGKFSTKEWDEIEVTAFYMVNLPENWTLVQDVIKLCHSASNLCDLFQWVNVEKGMSNLPLAKQCKADKCIKDIFCHIVVIASKYEYDLPRLLHEKNIRIAEKYSESVGKLSKDNVINERYSSLSCFNSSDSARNGLQYNLDMPIKNLNCSFDDKLLTVLMESVGLIAELFQWDTDGTETNFTPPKHAHLTHQLAIILNTVMKIAQLHKIKLTKAFSDKMQKNSTKYPVSACKGIPDKYNDLEHNNPLESFKDMQIDGTTELTLGTASMTMHEFVVVRDWEQYHSPRNVVLGLFGEIGEVLELFLQKRTGKFISCLSDELADCIAYTVRLAEVCNIDITGAMLHYFPDTTI